MEFGKIENLELIRWGLPQNDPLTTAYLATLPKAPTTYRLGTPTWGSRTWLGKIYPREAKSQEFLYHYARSFNCIELNTTHYNIPNAELVESWRADVTPEFRFCPKFPQLISHRPNGLKDSEAMGAWRRALENFGTHLGVTWIQFPPYFDYSCRSQLHQFLESWPSAFPLALEFRHSSWFEAGRLLPALVSYLQKKGIGLVITDVAGRRDVLHASITAPFTLIRFIGNELHPSDFSRAEEWCERLKMWSEQGLKDVYFFVHEPDDITCPELTEYVVELFNRGLNAGWPSPLRGQENRLI